MRDRRPPRHPDDQRAHIESAAGHVEHGSVIRGLRQEVEQLKQVVALLLDAQVFGTALDPQAEPLKSLLAVRGAGSGLVLGTVSCPACGAAVQDELGVTRETCVFCGATVPTAR